MNPEPKFQVDPTHPLPLWRQIHDQVRWHVATGALPSGAAVPSVRALAHTLGVHTSTVVQAYDSLEEQGILEVRRGIGTFVAASRTHGAAGRRELESAALTFAGRAHSLGWPEELAVYALREAWARLLPYRP